MATPALDPVAFAAEFYHEARARGFRADLLAEIAGVPLHAYVRIPPTAANAPRAKLYLSSGVHGDEPAPPQTMLELLRRDVFDDRAEWYLVPLLNPTGFVKRTRQAHPRKRRRHRSQSRLPRPAQRRDRRAHPLTRKTAALRRHVLPSRGLRGPGLLSLRGRLPRFRAPFARAGHARRRGRAQPDRRSTVARLPARASSARPSILFSVKPGRRRCFSASTTRT